MQEESWGSTQSGVPDQAATRQRKPHVEISSQLCIQRHHTGSFCSQPQIENLCHEKWQMLPSRDLFCVSTPLTTLVGVFKLCVLLIFVVVLASLDSSLFI